MPGLWAGSVPGNRYAPHPRRAKSRPVIARKGSCGGSSNGRKPWRLTRPRNPPPIRPRCGWARRSARSKALPVGPNADRKGRVRRDLKRQKPLAANKAKDPAPDPAKVRVGTEICPIKGFTSWTECTVPIHVLLLRDAYVDGHQDSWALMEIG